MPDITMTRQTNLRGTALQNAVNTMVAAMGRRQPFNMAPIQPTWESGSRLTFTASAMGQQQANGSIDIRDGSPSTVTAQVNLLTSLSRGYRADVERAMVEESDRALQPVGGATQQAAPAQTSTQTSTQTATQSTSRTRNDFDWDLFSTILGGVLDQAGNTVQAYNQAAGYTAQLQAQQIAAETVQSVTKPGATAAPAPRPTVVRGQPVAPVQTGPAMSTIGWIVLGTLGLGVVGLIIAVAAKKSKKSEEE